jgi:hypothetical protein
VVNITSAAVKAPIDILGLSNGARSGLTGFVAGLARQPQLVGRNVTVNNLLPGPFDTDRLRGTMAGAAAKTGKPLDTIMDERRALNPSRRFGTADEFGAYCAFLCSVHAGYVTGQNLLIDINEREFENHLFVLRFQELHLYVLNGGEALVNQGVEGGNGCYFKAGVFIVAVLDYTCGCGDVGFEC